MDPILTEAIRTVFGIFILLTSFFGFGLMFLMWLEPWDSSDLSSAATVKEWFKSRVRSIKRWCHKRKDYKIDKDWP